jgi:CDP-diacylglycerol--glycerol-3-phosphate 3-phosphatidyltransferase
MAPVSPDPEIHNPFQDRIVTIPNIICGIRFLGSLGLVGLALTGRAQLFAGFFTILMFSDWIDGRLARWLNQRSDFGARFDSFADSFLYAVLFFGLACLCGDVLKHESPWWLAAFLSYVLTTSAGLLKYGRIPSYHTYGAKISYWLILIGAISVLLGYSVWPFRIAMLSVTLANIEATVITSRLSEWRADVLSLRHLQAKQTIAATEEMQEEPLTKPGTDD